MYNKQILYGLVVGALTILPLRESNAQYADFSGNNPYIREYLQADEDNWNKSIIYVFYNNASCDACAAAMGMIYNIYEQNYSGQYSYFEINYADPENITFRLTTI